MGTGEATPGFHTWTRGSCTRGSSIAKATAVAIEAFPSDVTSVAEVTAADDVKNSDTSISKGAADSLAAPSSEKTPDNKTKVAHSLQLLERPS